MLTNSIPADKLNWIAQATANLRRTPEKPVDASIIIPVNAQGDLLIPLSLLEDLRSYSGPYAFEVILVINNYPPDRIPAEIEDFRSAGVRVVNVPDARKPGEVVIISARALGVKAAQSNITIHFDADCRIPSPTSLLNFYVGKLQGKVDLAYSHVAFYDLRARISVYAKILIHHFVRFLKRSFLRIPTTRGSNYAIKRDVFLKLYDEHMVSVDMLVGPAAKLIGAQIQYSGRKDLYVLTSGRRFKGGWGRIPRYFTNRLKYNIFSLSVLQKRGISKNWKGFDQENENRQLLTTDNGSQELEISLRSQIEGK